MDKIRSEDKVKDVTQNPYYKKLQKEIRAKKDAELKKASDTDAVSDKKEKEAKLQESKDISKDPLFGFDIEDDVRLSSMSWEETVLPDGDTEEEKEVKDKEKLEKDLKANGERILRYLGHKIDFKARIPELKEMFAQALVQSRSHNAFMARFGKFKVGVMGQVLSAVGVNTDELLALKRGTIKKAFEDNVDMMGENIYNRELKELIYGRSKYKKSQKLYAEVEQQLVSQMTQLGRPGYWSKSRLLEEKITQLDRIFQEFKTERDNLYYQYEYMVQEDQQEAA